MAKRGEQVRLDRLLLDRGLAVDEGEAQGLVLAGRVLVGDQQGREQKIDKPASKVDRASSIRLLGDKRRFVSRAGEKLAAALDAFAIDPRGWVCLDVGLSTGGFSDCLLSRGALRVHGVDVAYGVVDFGLRRDPRLVLHERTNARNLAPGALGEQVRLAVADVSFISLLTLLPPIRDQLAAPSDVVLLVKPQFEVDRGQAEGGVVRDPAARQAAITRVAEAALALGFVLRGGLDSPLPGAEGNVEHLLHLSGPA